MSTSVGLWLILTLSHTALGGNGKDTLVRLKEGGSFTINCSTDKPHDSLSLKIGHGTTMAVVLHLDLKSRKLSVDKTFEGRIKLKEHKHELLNQPITIENLSVKDTQVYRCVYYVPDTYKGDAIDTQRESVLLVVDAKQCDNTDSQISNVSIYVLLGLASISSTLLLIVLVLYLCPKKKSRLSRKRVTPTRPNDVYEVMQGTIKR